MLISAATDPIYDILALAHWFHCFSFFFRSFVLISLSSFDYHTIQVPVKRRRCRCFFCFLYFSLLLLLPRVIYLIRIRLDSNRKSFFLLQFRCFSHRDRFLHDRPAQHSLRSSNECDGTFACVRACVRAYVWHNAAMEAIKFFFKSNKKRFEFSFWILLSRKLCPIFRGWQIDSWTRPTMPMVHMVGDGGCALNCL